MKQQLTNDVSLYSAQSSRLWTVIFTTLVAIGLGYSFILALNSSVAAAWIFPLVLLVAFLWGRISDRNIPIILSIMFLLLPFQQSITGDTINVSATDAIALLLALALPVLAIRNGSLRTGPVGLPLFIFFSVATISSLAFWEGPNTADSLFRMFVVTVVAVLIFANVPLKLNTAHRCFWGYLVGINVLSILTTGIYLTSGWLASQSPLGIYKNALGPTFGCGVVIALTYLLTSRVTQRQRIWLILSLGGATIGLILSLSRGGWVATSVAVLLVLLMTKNYKASFISVIVLTLCIAAVWHSLPSEAKEYAANVALSSSNIHSRFVTMGQVMTAFHSNPLMGVGVGLRKHQEPHNVLILTLGETGIIGLAAFIGMFLSGFYTFYLASRATRDDARAWPLVVIGAGVLLLSLTHGMMDVYWRRGVGFMGWSSVGIAVNLIAQKKREFAEARANAESYSAL